MQQKIKNILYFPTINSKIKHKSTQFGDLLITNFNMSLEEINDRLDKMGNAWEHFKSVNNERLRQIEKKEVPIV